MRNPFSKINSSRNTTKSHQTSHSSYISSHPHLWRLQEVRTTCSRHPYHTTKSYHKHLIYIGMNVERSTEIFKKSIPYKICPDDNIKYFSPKGFCAIFMIFLKGRLIDLVASYLLKNKLKHSHIFTNFYYIPFNPSQNTPIHQNMTNKTK